MKRVINFLACGAIMLYAQMVMAQNVDETRMNRDIAVAENVLSTLIKQEFSKRSFFPVEVRGNYRPGYGITFIVPTDMLIPMVWGGDDDFVVLDGTPGAYSYSFSFSGRNEDEGNEIELENKRAQEEQERANSQMKKTREEMRKSEVEMKRDYKSAVNGRTPPHFRQNTDSLRLASNALIVTAAKNFIADYGDMISQLSPTERIVITNQGAENQRWYFRQNESRPLISVEGTKGDLIQFRQGKMTRDQFMSKLKITNTNSSGKIEPDLELLTSIFDRLYRSDLSKSFFIEGNTYYERLNDYGAIIYMQVYSSNQIDERLYNMPTVGLRGVDQATRDKKVKELYPEFEKELKENIVEYGRTLKSLKDDELLVFKVTLTRCKGCGIPSDVEVSVKNSVLNEYSSGKIDRNAALAKVSVKKGTPQ